MIVGIEKISVGDENFSDRDYLKRKKNIKLISLHHFRYKIGTKKG